MYCNNKCIHSCVSTAALRQTCTRAAAPGITRLQPQSAGPDRMTDAISALEALRPLPPPIISRATSKSDLLPRDALTMSCPTFRIPTATDVSCRTRGRVRACVRQRMAVRDFMRMRHAQEIQPAHLVTGPLHDPPRNPLALTGRVRGAAQTGPPPLVFDLVSISRCTRGHALWLCASSFQRSIARHSTHQLTPGPCQPERI